MRLLLSLLLFFSATNTLDAVAGKDVWRDHLEADAPARLCLQKSIERYRHVRVVTIRDTFVVLHPMLTPFGLRYQGRKRPDVGRGPDPRFRQFVELPEPDSLPWVAIREIDVRTGRAGEGIATGIAVGGGTGLAAGVGIAVAAPDDHPEYAMGAMLLVVPGMILGMLIGAVAGSSIQKWRAIYHARPGTDV